MASALALSKIATGINNGRRQAKLDGQADEKHAINVQRNQQVIDHADKNQQRIGVIQGREDEQYNRNQAIQLPTETVVAQNAQDRELSHGRAKLLQENAQLAHETAKLLNQDRTQESAIKAQSNISKSFNNVFSHSMIDPVGAAAAMNKIPSSGVTDAATMKDMVVDRGGKKVRVLMPIDANGNPSIDRRTGKPSSGLPYDMMNNLYRRASQGKGDRRTATERNINMLLEMGIATDPTDAWKKLNSSKSNPEEQVRKWAQMAIKARDDSMVMAGDPEYKTNEQLIEAAREIVAGNASSSPSQPSQGTGGAIGAGQSSAPESNPQAPTSEAHQYFEALREGNPGAPVEALVKHAKKKYPEFAIH